jgi:hypothetical protein
MTNKNSPVVGGNYVRNEDGSLTREGDADAVTPIVKNDTEAVGDMVADLYEDVTAEED